MAYVFANPLFYRSVNHFVRHFCYWIHDLVPCSFYSKPVRGHSSTCSPNSSGHIDVDSAGAEDGSIGNIATITAGIF